MQRQILVAVEEAFGAHQHSNEEPNVWRSVTVQPMKRKVVSFKSDAIEKHDFFFANIVLCKRKPYCENRRMAPVFLLSCSLKHLLRFEKHDQRALVFDWNFS